MGNPIDRYSPDDVAKVIAAAITEHTSNIDAHYYRAGHESISCDSVGELAAQITPAATVAVLRAAAAWLREDGYTLSGVVLAAHADEIAADEAAADAWMRGETDG